MAGILWTNPLMAVSSTECSSSLGINYAENSIFSTGFCTCQRPGGFSAALQLQRAILKHRVKCSLEKGVIEKKKFEFKPSFDEYLKAMESVKTGREKKPPRSLRKRDENGAERKKRTGVVIEERKIDDGDLPVQVKRVVDKNERQIKKSEDSNSISSKSIVSQKTTRKSEVLDVERAAFKTMEENNNLYYQPRVTRMDMEERIQKLANCLNGADIEIPEWMFSKMMRSAKIRFSDHSILRVIQILGKFGNWRRVLQVIEWIQSRERFKSHKLRYIYTAALDALGKSRRPVEAFNLFCAMQQHISTYPDLVAYRSVAVTLGQAGHMKELFDVIDSMQSPPKKKFKTGLLEKWDPRLEPDIIVYNSVLNACVKRKNWEGAFWVLQQLKQQGQQPSSTTYGLVMEVMYACGKYNLVHDFFRRMQKSCIPNALTYKVLMKTFSSEGKVDEAILAVEEMERRGVVGTASLYYELACCLCTAGRTQEALLQIDKICKVASKPLVVTYTGLIQACLSSGNIQDGAYIFNYMQKFCSPNLVTYKILLKGFLDHEMLEEAKELFLRLLANIESLSRKGHYENKVIPDLYTFNLMLDACLAKQKWEDLEFFYVKMLKYGYHFNAKRHLQMILDACRAGKVEILETTWKHLIQEDRIPPLELTTEMFHVKLQQQGDCSEAISYLALMDSKAAFSTKWWFKFFRENAHYSPGNKGMSHLVDLLNSIAPKTESHSQLLEILKMSCEKFLSENQLIGTSNLARSV